jgi:predicted ATPase
MSGKISGLASRNYLLQATLLRGGIPSFDEHPFNVPAIYNFRDMVFDQPVTFLVGENGSGKSTLLEAIAIAWGFNPEGGSRDFVFATRESHSGLHRHLRLSRGRHRAGDGFFLRAESFYNLASTIEALGGTRYGDKSLHEQSHGESFLALVANRFNGSGFYVLDEPESALSPTRQLSLLSLMHDLVMDGAQFLIATHSPILMAYPHATIFTMSEEGPREISYRATEHFAVTKRFLNDPEGMLKAILEPEED